MSAKFTQEPVKGTPRTAVDALFDDRDPQVEAPLCELHPNLKVCACLQTYGLPKPEQARIVSISGRAQPTARGLTNSREHFEKLIYEITGCKTGDGTLQVNPDARHTYVNPHTQHLWERYQSK